MSCLFLAVLCCEAKDVKITVSPSDAKINIDGSYKADGIYTASFKKKDEFIVIKIEKAGYVTLETKFFYSDKRKAISYTLRKDDTIENSIISANANQDFSVTVNPKFSDVEAWKILNQIILNYFDEIKISDKMSGYLQTAWVYQSFPESKLQVRTRVTVKETMSSDGLSYKIKVSSEIADIQTNTEEGFSEWSRILKKYANIISEYQSRLGGL